MSAAGGPASPDWVLRPQPQRRPRARLFCFPGVGGGASMFAGWSGDLPAAVELCCLQPPGRETRYGEALVDELPTFVEAASRSLLPLLDVPFALFGHSLGALAAYETATHLRRMSQPAPVHLFVSAHRACHLPSRFPPIHHLPDRELVDAIVTAYRGIPDVLLREREFMLAWLPVLRADLTMLERYVYRPDPPLDCAVSAFAGADDPMVARDELESWRVQTSMAFTLRTFGGDHFYFRRARQPLLAAVVADLADSLGTGHPSPGLLA